MSHLTYFWYLVLSVTITVWVGWTLHKNGRLFVVEAFGGQEELADAVNHLLLVGFYLVNLGFVSLFLSLGSLPESVTEMIEYLSVKIGIVLGVLGFMHYGNVFNFGRMRGKAIRKKEQERRRTPVGESDYAGPGYTASSFQA